MIQYSRLPGKLILRWQSWKLKLTLIERMTWSFLLTFQQFAILKFKEHELQVLNLVVGK